MTERPLVVVTSVVIITAALASQIPQIEVDPTPERLMASVGEHNDRATEFRQTFGDSDKVLAILIEGPENFDLHRAEFVHRMSRHFQGIDWVDRVESITATPLPRQIEEPELSLEDLEAEIGQAEAEPLAPEVLDALSDLVSASPARFPEGFGAVAGRLSGGLVRTGPVVDGAEITESEFEELTQALQDAPLIRGRLLSADGRVAVVALTLRGPDVGHAEVANAIAGIRAWLAANPAPDGVITHLAGLPFMRAELVRNIRRDQLVLIPLTLLVCIVLLFVAFRWWAGTVLPIVGVALTAAATVGSMALTGQTMNVINNVIPSLLIIIGICDSIHLIGRYREELARGADRIQAAQTTFRSMAVACFLTSLTTAVGLASLIVAQTEMLQRFGLIAAAGVMIAYLVTITFLPSAISIIRQPENAAMVARGGWLEGVIVHMTAWILRHPWKVIGVSAIALATCAWTATSAEVDHALLDQFDESDPVYQTTRLMERELDGVRPLEVVITTRDEGGLYDPAIWSTVDQITRWAREDPAVARVMSAGDIFRESLVLLSEDPSAREDSLRSAEELRALYAILDRRDPHPLAPWLSPDGRQARIQLKLRDVGARATLAFVDALELRLAGPLQAQPGTDFYLTGDAYTGSRGLEAVVEDLLASLFTAVVIIFLILTLLFRSLRLGLISIPPNIIPLVATMAYMVVRGIPLNAATAIIFSISIGLAVDGTIHVLARYREESRRLIGQNAALIRSARGTGRAIVVSCLTLTAGFAVLLFSALVPVRHFGELIAVTVFGCLIGTMVVQPALLKVAGRRRTK